MSELDDLMHLAVKYGGSELVSSFAAAKEREIASLESQLRTERDLREKAEADVRLAAKVMESDRIRNAKLELRVVAAEDRAEKAERERDEVVGQLQWAIKDREKLFGKIPGEYIARPGETICESAVGAIALLDRQLSEARKERDGALQAIPVRIQQIRDLERQLSEARREIEALRKSGEGLYKHTPCIRPESYSQEQWDEAREQYARWRDLRPAERKGAEGG